MVNEKVTTDSTPKPKVERTWLQCELPRTDWEALNQRRLALNLKWPDIIVPGTVEYLAKLEHAGKVTEQQQKPKGKGKRSKKGTEPKGGEQ
jgi:hypothetical protein